MTDHQMVTLLEAIRDGRFAEQPVDNQLLADALDISLAPIAARCRRPTLARSSRAHARHASRSLVHESRGVESMGSIPRHPQQRQLSA